MSVATSDSGAGAGIQAGLKTFLRCGVYGTTAIVATAAQNTVGVTDIFPFPPGVAVKQMETVAGDIGADAVKTGMLFDAGIISAVAGAVGRLGLPNLVIDPVMVAESEATLLELEAVETYRVELFPLARVLTPNANRRSRSSASPWRRGGSRKPRRRSTSWDPRPCSSPAGTPSRARTSSTTARGSRG